MHPLASEIELSSCRASDLARSALGAALMALSVAGLPAQGAVVTNVNDSGTGSLRQAIADAADGETISFAVSLPATILLTSGELVVEKNLTITGPGADRLAVDGGLVDRVFRIRGGFEVEITGLTVQNGLVGFSETGGGIRVEDAGTRLTVTDSAIRDNRAWIGAGLYATPNTEVTLLRDAVHDNAVTGFSGGGGIYADNATVVITTTTISGNESTAAGAGLHFYSGFTGSVSIASSTIAGNISDSGGGGIRATTTEPVTLTGTIVAGNVPLDCEGTITSSGHNLATDSTCNLIEPSDQPGSDPQIGPLEDNGGPTLTHALPAGSPAIDLGDCAFSESLDQRGTGFPRPVDFVPPGPNDACDVGAFELQADPGGCPATQEVQKLRLGKAGLIDLVASWEASTDPCIDGYAIISGESLLLLWTNPQLEAQTGLETGVAFTPDGNVFIVLGTSGGTTGPWGH